MCVCVWFFSIRVVVKPCIAGICQIGRDGFPCTLFPGFKSSNGNFRGIIALILSCGWVFFPKEPFYKSEMTFSFSGLWVGTRGGKLNQDEIQGVRVSFCSVPWTQSDSGSSPLVSDQCLHCTQVHSGFHDPKQQLLFLRIYYLAWHSQKFNFYTPALFPTAFSSLCTISCCTASVPHVFIIEEGSWAPLRKAEFFWVSAGVIWNGLSAFLHPSSQFRNVPVLCMQVCHICQLHMVVWNILKHLKRCWISTCDGCTKLWSSLSKQTSFNQGHPGVSLYSRSWILSEMSCQAHCDVKENCSLL